MQAEMSLFCPVYRCFLRRHALNPSQPHTNPRV